MGKQKLPVITSHESELHHYVWIQSQILCTIKNNAVVVCFYMELPSRYKFLEV